jgi:hypothetical protein
MFIVTVRAALADDTQTFIPLGGDSESLFVTLGDSETTIFPAPTPASTSAPTIVYTGNSGSVVERVQTVVKTIITSPRQIIMVAVYSSIATLFTVFVIYKARKIIQKRRQTQ